MHSWRGRWGVVAVLVLALMAWAGCKGAGPKPDREGPFENRRVDGRFEGVDTQAGLVRCTITEYRKVWYKDSSKTGGVDIYKEAEGIPTEGDRFLVTFTSTGGPAVESHTIEVVGAAEVTDIPVPPKVRDWGSRNEGCTLSIVSPDAGDRVAEFERDPPVITAVQLSDMYFSLGGTRE